MLKIEIPDFLSHLKVDGRGYPIPFFVTMVDGKPDFRLLDGRKQEECLKRGLCEVCGKKLYKDYHYFISGPRGYKNKISSDPAMHKDCALFSLEACPHMHFERADRREKGELYNSIKDRDLSTVKEKPSTIFLIKSSKYDYFRNPVGDGQLIRYRAVAAQEYEYVDGILKEKKPLQ